MDRIAVVSDIHGNHHALAAVLADIDRRGIERIVNLGDSLYGPLDPRRTVEMLLEREMTTVRGNEDRILCDESAVGNPTVRYCRAMLSDRHLAWLESRPVAAVIEGEIVCFHASPTNDTEYLLWEVTPEGAVERSPEEIARRLGAWPGMVVLCGHDHVPRTLRLPGGELLVDPGSVGCPAYDDGTPHPHVMESGSPAARYAALRRERGNWGVEQVSVRYDYEAAARLAERNGRGDWAAWLRTGLASP